MRKESPDGPALETRIEDTTSPSGEEPEQMVETVVESTEEEPVALPEYYDKEDLNFCGILHRYEAIHGEGSWGREEAEALVQFTQVVEAEISPENGVLIDAGCGMGRLSCEYSPHFSKVIALEPDSDRLQSAIQRAIEEDLTGKIEFRNEIIQKMEAKGADAAICSHIIQHVPLESLAPIISSLNRSLRDNGILMLSTNSTGQENDKYTKLYWDGQNNIEEEISEEEFSNLQNNTEGILPIHWFSDKTLEDLLTANGFAVQDTRYLHGGRDVQIIARKVEEAIAEQQ